MQMETEGYVPPRRTYGSSSDPRGGYHNPDFDIIVIGDCNPDIVFAGTMSGPSSASTKSWYRTPPSSSVARGPSPPAPALALGFGPGSSVLPATTFLGATCWSSYETGA